MEVSSKSNDNKTECKDAKLLGAIIIQNTDENII